MKVISIVVFFISLLTIQFSHAFDLEIGINRKHSPFANNQCLACHQKDDKGNPISDKFVAAQPDLCYKCHERKDKGPVVHPALGMGDCTQCHSPHESQIRPLLNDTTENTCTMCHDAPGRELPIKHSALKMTKSCVRCHNPHSADRPKLLKAETSQLCVYCHTALSKGLNNPNFIVHKAVLLGCQNCHAPHGSNNEKLLRENPNGLCLNCHDKAKFKDGHPRPGHPTEGKSDPLYPERQLSCVSCHKPHFSANKKLLRYNFNRAPYDGKICTVCHWQVAMPQPGPPRPDWDE
jgi:predicted CXXCH cytochrome family protein